MILLCKEYFISPRVSLNAPFSANYAWNLKMCAFLSSSSLYNPVNNLYSSPWWELNLPPYIMSLTVCEGRVLYRKPISAYGIGRSILSSERHMTPLPSHCIIRWSWAKARNIPPAYAWPLITANVGRGNYKRRAQVAQVAWNISNCSIGLFFHTSKWKPVWNILGLVETVTRTPGPVVLSILSRIELNYLSHSRVNLLFNWFITI